MGPHRRRHARHRSSWETAPMTRLIAPLLLILVLALLSPSRVGAQQSSADPAAYLPRGATIVQTASGDVDGDGRPDIVALYSLRAPSATTARGGLLVLVTT